MALPASIDWLREPRFIVVSAVRTLAGTIDRILVEHPEWVVVVRTHRETGAIHRYAFTAEEVLERGRQWTGPARERTLEDTLNLHEYTSSRCTRGRRELAGSPDSGGGPAFRRVVELDADGRVAGIGAEAPPRMAPRVPPASRAAGEARARPRAGDDAFSLETAVVGGVGDELLGGGPADLPEVTMVQPPAAIEATLSAQAPAEVMVGQLQTIDFRVETSEGAEPLAEALDVLAKPGKPIRVLVSLQTPGLSVDGPSEMVLAPPAPGQPREGCFQVRGEAPGVVHTAVTFRQGGSELGAIALAIEVVQGQASARQLDAHAEVTTPDPADEDMLQLLIEQKVGSDGATRYEYRLYSEALGFNYLTLQSAPLLDRGDGRARTLLDYVDRIYERTTRELRTADDLKDQQRELRALGVSLSTELFDPDVVRQLWPLRSQISLIRLTSWEPYIPWELLRMRNPDTREVDGRFLAEYGLIRSQPGESPARSLSLRDWRWLAADFPMSSMQPAGDMAWFSALLARQGIAPTRIPARADALLDTLGEGAFDVLHLACHSESPQDRIDRALLILGDRAQPGTTNPELVSVDTAGVDAEARLHERRPLVFLNACETGRLAPNLTAWGGWPQVFLRAGAGAFVGTSWAVQSGPAAGFAQAFYGALLAGRMLHQAAAAARTAGQAAGDASWLAFKVYGHPRARRAP